MLLAWVEKKKEKEFCRNLTNVMEGKKEKRIAIQCLEDPSTENKVDD